MVLPFYRKNLEGYFAGINAAGRSLPRPDLYTNILSPEPTRFLGQKTVLKPPMIIRLRDGFAHHIGIEVTLGRTLPHLQILRVVIIEEHHIWGGVALIHETRDTRSH